MFKECREENDNGEEGREQECHGLVSAVDILARANRIPGDRDGERGLGCLAPLSRGFPGTAARRSQSHSPRVGLGPQCSRKKSKDKVRLTCDPATSPTGLLVAYWCCSLLLLVCKGGKPLGKPLEARGSG